MNMDEIVSERGGYCKYAYLSPKMKKIVGGSVIALAFIVGIAAVSNRSTGSWPPPEVTSDFNLSTDGSPVNLSLNLKTGKRYLQRTEMETSTSISFDNENFAETLHMTTENTVDVDKWFDEDGELKGRKAEVTFTHVAVTTMDSEGDATYYNSLANNGDTDFDETLETMIGESATIFLDTANTLIKEQDSQNALEAMEQEYSLGTTTGLSATDQVGIITNVVAFLPESATDLTSVGEVWDIEFETDVFFKGSSTLKGFTKYNGVDCAVIESKAEVDADNKNVLGTDDGFLEVKNGKVNTLTFFDIKEKIPVYMKSTIIMTTDIEGLEGDDYDYDEDEMEIPMKEQIEMFLAPY